MKYCIEINPAHCNPCQERNHHPMTGSLPHSGKGRNSNARRKLETGLQFYVLILLCLEGRLSEKGSYVLM